MINVANPIVNNPQVITIFSPQMVGLWQPGFSQPQVRSVPPPSRPTLSSTSRWPWSLWLGEDGDEFVARGIQPQIIHLIYLMDFNGT